MHFDFRFQVMVLWDLDDMAMIAHHVIIAHSALLFNAQDILQSGGKGPEGRALLPGLNGKTSIMRLNKFGVPDNPGLFARNNFVQ